MALTSSRLRAVTAVYEAGNFTAAAARLGLRQPSVAQAVRDLEHYFAVTLFDRRGNGLVPTSLCEQLYHVAAKIGALEQDALQLLSQQRALKSGELRIGLGNLMPGLGLIRALQTRYPEIKVRVETGSWSSILSAVSDQRVDLGILPQVPDDGRFVRTVCLYQRVVAIVPPAHPLAKQQSVTCAALAQERLILRTRQSSTRRIVDQAFRTAGVSVDPFMVLDSRDAVFETVGSGMGVGFMWETGYDHSDRVVKVPVVEMQTRYPEHIFALPAKRSVLVDLFFETPTFETPAFDTSKMVASGAGANSPGGNPRVPVS